MARTPLFCPPPKHVLREARPRPFFIYHFLARRSLILLQNLDVEKDAVGHHQSASRPESEDSLDVLSLSTKLQNPLAGKDKATLEKDAVSFCDKHGLMEHGTSRL